ncbi:MAG: DegT/DnrJ/EryC1/StrS family aminotransferase [Thermoleophilia bacterium]
MNNFNEVPFFNYPRLFLDEEQELMNIIKDVGHRGAFIMQQDLRDFEASLASYTGAKHAIGVANATDGLELAWMAVGLRPGDEVICCSHTMLATAASIVTAGGKPVPVELGPDNLIDPDAIEAAINLCTVGIMPTQLNGRTCNMDRIMAIADKNGLFVVEDAAQALGSKFKDKAAGTFGKAAAISFFPAKVLGCLGDGGGVITNDDYIYGRVYQLHDHGRDVNGEVRCWGRNSRLDNLQAAILNYRLKSYDRIIGRRRAIASLYQERLSEFDELQLPPAPDSDLDHFDIYQNYELQADRRDELKEFLRVNGIGTLIQWGGKAIHQFEHLGFTCRLPKVERFFERCLMLPMNMFISDDDVHYNCDKIREFYRG